MAKSVSQEKVQRRRALLIWGIIVILGCFSGLLVYSFLSSANKTVDILVASKDIPPYTQITEEYVEVISVQSDTYNTLTSSGGNVYEKKEDIIGNYSEVPIKKGEMFYRFKLADPVSGRYVSRIYEKPGYKLIPLQASVLNAGAGQLKAGDYIDVYMYDEILDDVLPILTSVKILDIKYGVNYFAPATEETSEKEGSTTDEEGQGAASTGDLGNINPSIGAGNTYILLTLPVEKAEKIIKSVLLETPLYFAATKPLSFKVFNNETLDKYENITVYDVILPTIFETGDIRILSEKSILEKGKNTTESNSTSEKEKDEESENNEESIEDTESVTPASTSPVDNSFSDFIIYQGKAIEITYMLNDNNIDYEQFKSFYEENQGNMSVEIVYTDTEQDNRKQIMQIRMLIN